MLSPLVWFQAHVLRQDSATVEKFSCELASRHLGHAVQLARSEGGKNDEAYLRGYLRAHVTEILQQEMAKLAPPVRLRDAIFAEAVEQIVGAAVEAVRREPSARHGLAAAA